MKQVVKGPNAVTAIQNTALSTIFNAENCAIVYDANGNYKSWVPGRDINSFTNIEVGKGYIPIMLSNTPIDVSAYFSDGLPTGGGGFAQGLYINSILSEDLTISFYNHTDEETVIGDAITLSGGGNPIFIALADFPVGADRVRLEGTQVINLVWYVVGDGELTFFENDTNPGFDLGASAYTFNLTELHNVSVVDIQPHVVPAENHFYISNLSGVSIDIVKEDHHDQIVHTLATNTFIKLAAADFNGEDWQFIPGGPAFKAINIQTFFGGTHNTNKYQIAGGGGQNISADLLPFGDCVLVILPDASDAGTWT